MSKFPHHRNFRRHGRTEEHRHFPRRFSRRKGFLFFPFIIALLGISAMCVGTVEITRLIFSFIANEPRSGNHLINGLLPLFLAGAFFIFIATSIARKIRRNFTNPFEEIIRTAEAIENGDLTARVTEKENHSINRLMRTFNRMADGIQQADYQRKSLTADIAHELRTPLQVIQGYIEGIIDKVYTADDATLNIMLDETKLLTRLIDDLQTLSSAELGELTLYKEQILIGDFLSDLIVSFNPKAIEESVLLSFTSPENMTILADNQRLSQVMINLLANSFRHVSKGGKINIIAQELDNEFIQIEVIDNGEGISEEDLPYIFDRFYRADKARSRKSGGAGLGLSIAKQIIELHKGKINVESEIGKGTTFIILLPISNNS